MQTTLEFEKYLQEQIDPTINFREHPVNKDIVGIYWGDIYTETAIPSQNIREERDPMYTDLFGYPHRGSIEAEARVKMFIDRFNSDEEFKNDVLGIETEAPADSIHEDSISKS